MGVLKSPRYYEKKLTTQKVAIIQLHRTGLAEQKQIAQAFGMHPNTVNNLIRSYGKIKDLSFLQRRRGPKELNKIKFTFESVLLISLTLMKWYNSIPHLHRDIVY